MGRLKKKVYIRGVITLKTGLHIGAGQEKVQIGGLDNPVVRAILKNNEPIIPGSSLKGKIRSLLEQAYGQDCVGDMRQKTSNHKNCPICNFFGGIFDKDESVASRILFRDAYLTEESKRRLEQAATDYPYTEVKYETAINRIEGKALSGSLRNTERVPAGAVFDVDFVVNVYDGEDEAKNMQLLQLGFLLLNHDYLGGSGSRGYGHVELKINEVKVYQLIREADALKWEENTNPDEVWRKLLSENYQVQKV
jgi:CRISPR-associated protein Csm3